MPTSFEIASSEGNYTVEIRRGAATELLARHQQAHIIADEVMKQMLKDRQGFSIVATEEAKEYDAIGAYLKQLRELKLTRGGSIIAIGGGVIQDIAGFAASIYMRGITWHYAPTTLLGMVDSCIGGKSSINVQGSKNLVGTFHPPASIVVDPDFIKTLKAEQKIDGLCEAAKICFAHSDPDVFASYLATAPDAYETIITKSLQAKKWFIETDEFDRNERQLLNFGHGFGHAIEAGGHYSISHGIAVGLGMLCAIEFQMLAEPGFSCHPLVMELRSHIESLLASLPALKPALRKLDMSAMLDAFRADKKHTQSEYTVIVPDAKGRLIRKKISRSGEALIRQALQKVIALYG